MMSDNSGTSEFQGSGSTCETCGSALRPVGEFQLGHHRTRIERPRDGLTTTASVQPAPHRARRGLRVAPLAGSLPRLL